MKHPIRSVLVALIAVIVLGLVLEVIIVERTRESADSIRTRLSRDLPEGTSEQAITEYLTREGMEPFSFVTRSDDSAPHPPFDGVHVPANTEIIQARVSYQEVIPMYSTEVIEIYILLDKGSRRGDIYVTVTHPNLP